jgi:hypothetical protein
MNIIIFFSETNIVEKLGTLLFRESSDHLIYIPEKWLLESYHIHRAHFPTDDTPVSISENMMKHFYIEKWEKMKCRIFGERFLYIF